MKYATIKTKTPIKLYTIVEIIGAQLRSATAVSTTHPLKLPLFPAAESTANEYPAARATLAYASFFYRWFHNADIILREVDTAHRHHAKNG